MKSLEIDCDHLGNSAHIQWIKNIKQYDAIVINFEQLKEHAFIILYYLLDTYPNLDIPIFGYSKKVTPELKLKGKEFGLRLWIVAVEGQGFKDAFLKLLQSKESLAPTNKRTPPALPHNAPNFNPNSLPVSGAAS